MKASIKGTFTKSCAASPFRFQWQNLMADDFLGPGFISMSPDFRSTWVFKNDKGVSVLYTACTCLSLQYLVIVTLQSGPINF